MRQLGAFLKKEWMEQVRTGRFWMLLILFVLFGITSPAIAKLTPWLFEMMAEEMAEQGLILQSVEVTALTSWQQFYKNISMMLLVLVMMISGTLTGEYQKETLIPVLTKGLPRWKVIAAKSLMQTVVWTVCYWTAFFVTYGYTVYYWDNSIIRHCFLAGTYAYLLGIWLITLIFLGSAICDTNMSVLFFVGEVFAVCYLAGLVPTITEYFPVKLLSAGALLDGSAKVTEFGKAVAVSLISGAGCLAGAVAVFQKRKL